MCGGSKGQTKSQQTSTTSATPEAMAAYRDILSRAQEVAQTPYQAYEGQRVAGFTPYQEQAFGQIAGAQGAGMGTLGEAGELARRGAAQITAADIQRGMDPYQQQVIQTTMDEMARQNAIEQSRLQGQAISAGAFGGDRAGIAATELAKRQGDVRAATLSSLLSQGYGRAVAQAQADRQAAQVGTGQLMGVAQQEFGMPLAQARALAEAGTAQQQLAQQQLNVPYQTYLEQRAYPFQQAQWLAGLATGVGGAMGGTTQAQGTATPAQPNPLNPILGAGLSLAPFLLSDEKAKDNIVPVGKLNDGQTVYKYNYKGEPGTHLGLLAQEVEKAHPEAVGEVGGLKMVNYDAATKDAVPHKADGGGLSIPMDGQAVLPYSQGFIPKAMPMRALQAPQANLQMPGEAPDQSKQFVAQAMDLAKSIRDRRQTEMPSAQSWASGTTITPEPTPEWGYMADGGRVPMQDGGVPVEEVPVRRVDAPPIVPEEDMKTGLKPIFEGLYPMAQVLPPPTAKETFSGPAVRPSAPTPVELPPFESARVVGDTPGLTAGTAYQPPPMQPPMGLGAREAAPPAAQPKGGFELSPEARQAMMQAGFALMASRSPFLGQAIGEAGMTGVQAYSQAQQIAEQRRKTAEAEKLRREQIEETRRKTAEAEKLAVRRQEEVERRNQEIEDLRRATIDAKQAAESAKDPIAAARAKSDLKQLEAIKATASGASEGLAALDTIDGVIKQAWTGPLVGRAALLLGDRETAILNTQSSALSLALAQKMKGALSDKDLQFLQGQVPGITTSPEAAKAISDVMRRAFERAQQRADFYEDWFSKYKSLEGAERNWRRFSEENPLTVDDEKAPGGRKYNPSHNRDYSSYLDKNLPPKAEKKPEAAGPALTPTDKSKLEAGALPLPMTRDGKPDKSKMIVGKTYIHNGRVGTWTGTDLELMK